MLFVFLVFVDRWAMASGPAASRSRRNHRQFVVCCWTLHHGVCDCTRQGSGKIHSGHCGQWHRHGRSGLEDACFLLSTRKRQGWFAGSCFSVCNSVSFCWQKTKQYDDTWAMQRQFVSCVKSEFGVGFKAAAFYLAPSVVTITRSEQNCKEGKPILELCLAKVSFCPRFCGLHCHGFAFC
jgi:hypothetical protein